MAFGAIDAEALYQSALWGGQTQLASEGGAVIGFALLVTGVGLAAGSVATARKAPWALAMVAPMLLLSLLVAGVGERSASGVLANIVLVVAAWQVWRTEPAWVFRRTSS